MTVLNTFGNHFLVMHLSVMDTMQVPFSFLHLKSVVILLVLLLVEIDTFHFLFMAFLDRIGLISE